MVFKVFAEYKAVFIYSCNFGQNCAIFWPCTVGLCEAYHHNTRYANEQTLSHWDSYIWIPNLYVPNLYSTSGLNGSHRSGAQTMTIGRLSDIKTSYCYWVSISGSSPRCLCAYSSADFDIHQGLSEVNRSLRIHGVLSTSWRFVDA